MYAAHRLGLCPASCFSFGFPLLRLGQFSAFWHLSLPLKHLNSTLQWSQGFANTGPLPGFVRWFVRS